MSDRPYVPQRFEIIGLTLIGWKLSDGSIMLDSGAIFPEWPKVVSHNGVVVGLTRVDDKGPIRTKRVVDVEPIGTERTMERMEFAVYEDGLQED